MVADCTDGKDSVNSLITEVCATIKGHLRRVLMEAVSSRFTQRRVAFVNSSQSSHKLYPGVLTPFYSSMMTSAMMLASNDCFWVVLLGVVYEFD